MGFSDTNHLQMFLDILQSGIEEIADMEEEEHPKEDVKPQAEPKKKKKKPKNFGRSSLPYDANAHINDPKSWPDNPEEYLK